MVLIFQYYKCAFCYICIKVIYLNSKNKHIVKASWISLVGNAFLAVAKISVGFIGGSLALIGDGIDSSIDVVMSVVTLVTARIINKPPDFRFAYGYEKADSIAAKVLSFFIFFAGAELAISSIRRFFREEAIQQPEPIAIIVVLASVLIKILLSIYQFRVGKKTNSNMLLANAKNMKYDVGISVTVLAGLLVVEFFAYPLADAIAALIISLWVMKGAFEIFKDSSTELMDGVKDTTVYNKIFEAAEEVPGVRNPHRVRSRQIGNMHMIVIDIEIDGTKTLSEAHHLSHVVEEKIRAKVENVYDVVIHAEPFDNYEKDERQGVRIEDIQ